ncbi:MAG: hypothetical protein KF878_21280 [Planctomycetes bacterium]|nr:hypothetical protein [Planctomycetota bacterium]
MHRALLLALAVLLLGGCQGADERAPEAAAAPVLCCPNVGSFGVTCLCAGQGLTPDRCAEGDACACRDGCCRRR